MVDEKPSGTCRAFYGNKLWNVVSCWLYSANILTMHGPVNVKFYTLISTRFILENVTENYLGVLM